MAVARDLCQYLDLFLATPDMVWCEQADGKRVLARRGRIDPDDGLVWAFARTTTKGGVGVDSVITFNTTVPSALKSAYWHVDGHWFEPAYPEDRPALFATLGVQQEDVFPYSWKTHAPLAPAPRHGISATRRFLRKFF